MRPNKQGTKGRLMCVTIADLDDFKISQRMGHLVPSLDCWRSGLPSAKRRKEALGVKLSQRLVLWEVPRHTFFTNFFTCLATVVLFNVL